MKPVQTFLASLTGIVLTIGVILFVMWKDCTDDFRWWYLIAIVVGAVAAPFIYKEVFTDLKSSKEA